MPECQLWPAFADRRPMAVVRFGVGLSMSATFGTSDQEVEQPVHDSAADADCRLLREKTTRERDSRLPRSRVG
jgi:hypothetical protein